MNMCASQFFLYCPIVLPKFLCPIEVGWCLYCRKNDEGELHNISHWLIFPLRAGCTSQLLQFCHGWDWTGCILQIHETFYFRQAYYDGSIIVVSFLSSRFLDLESSKLSQTFGRHFQADTEFLHFPNWRGQLPALYFWNYLPFIWQTSSRPICTADICSVVLFVESICAAQKKRLCAWAGFLIFQK